MRTRVTSVYGHFGLPLELYVHPAIDEHAFLVAGVPVPELRAGLSSGQLPPQLLLNEAHQQVLLQAHQEKSQSIYPIFLSHPTNF